MDSMRPPLGPIVCVVGARPNFMKMAPVIRALGARPRLPSAVLVHTGQHYDEEMSERFLRDLGMPRPAFNLAAGGGTPAEQTAEMIRRFDPVLAELAPACVIVVGDVNSTVAATLTAVRRGVPVVHVEAGLRSFDRTMPEELNRLVTDQLSELLFTTEPSADDNLAREGIARDRIRQVGNVMIDTLFANLERAPEAREVLAAEKLEVSTSDDGSPAYALATLHRPSNVDDPKMLRALLETLAKMAARLPIVWPVHPRARASIERFGLQHLVTARLHLAPPQGYLEMLALMRGARVVVTDSGGVQEETTALCVPCITLRDNTERPITITEGSNALVGREPQAILRAFAEALAGPPRRGRCPLLWDGRAAERIALDLEAWLHSRVAAATTKG